MNFEEGNADYLSLKSLLQQWRLPHLLQYFLEQKINIDVLEMMKPHHIFELLQIFPFGDRIRFEYELEKWRYSLGCPLQSSPLTMPLIVQRGTPFETLTVKSVNYTRRDCETQTLKPMVGDPNQLPKKATDDEFENIQVEHHMSPPPPPLSLSLTTTTSDSPKRRASQSNAIYSPRMRLPTPPPVRDPNLRGRPSTDLVTRQMALQLDARDILQRCRPRGPELIKIYETNKRFRPVERVELINLFAHYFYEHSIHLPVKLSYELERQILQLFPGERLKDYRTEKRGKIYIRLSNIKNNRRRAREAKANGLRGLEKIDDSLKSNGIDNPKDRGLDEVECLREDYSDSFDRPLRMCESDIKCETGDDVEFQD